LLIIDSLIMLEYVLTYLIINYKNDTGMVWKSNNKCHTHKRKCFPLTTLRFWTKEIQMQTIHYSKSTNQINTLQIHCQGNKSTTKKWDTKLNKCQSAKSKDFNSKFFKRFQSWPKSKLYTWNIPLSLKNTKIT
jgi:hypothetical protein